MSSTDSDSSSAAVSLKKQTKSSKKSKRKSQKKHKKEKRNKQKKRSKHERVDRSPYSSEDPDSSRKILPVMEVVENTDCFGPALPPHLLNSPTPVQATVLIGPQMPNDFNVHVSGELLKPVENITKQSVCCDEEEDDTTSTFGPFPPTSDGNAQPTSDAQLKLEERALQLKLAAIDGTINKTVDQKVREEWMLELPEVGLKGGLAALSNMKRKFHHGKERPDFSDRSEWTKTPQASGSVNEVNPDTSKVAKTLMSDAQAFYERQRDEEQERIARKHKKKHKRDESLVELHQKKLRKEQKEKEKELAAAGAKPERRPFSRDVDLKLNKIDKNQTKSIVDKAKVLNTKFATGHVKYL